MKWTKHGLIFRPSGKNGWARHTASQPTPVLISDKVIRVFIGCRDEAGVTRIGYVDVRADNPAHVLATSAKPVLDVGRDGMFDDNGVILGDVVRRGGELWMYYVGFQLVAKAKFLAFSGLASSHDGGASFVRRSETPVLDRADEGPYIRAIHTALHEDGHWKIWYAAGDGWEWTHGKPFPRYHIRYSESRDGMTFPICGHVCIQPDAREYRIGRPRVYRTDHGYEMFYTKGTLDGEYLPGYAKSSDGIHWKRYDDQIGIAPSPNGWDSEALSYMSLLSHGPHTYAFYNGNNFGESGFGYAVIES